MAAKYWNGSLCYTVRDVETHEPGYRMDKKMVAIRLGGDAEKVVPESELTYEYEATTRAVKEDPPHRRVDTPAKEPGVVAHSRVVSLSPSAEAKAKADDEARNAKGEADRVHDASKAKIADGARIFSEKTAESVAVAEEKAKAAAEATAKAKKAEEARIGHIKSDAISTADAKAKADADTAKAKANAETTQRRADDSVRWPDDPHKRVPAHKRGR